MIYTLRIFISLGILTFQKKGKTFTSHMKGLLTLKLIMNTDKLKKLCNSYTMNSRETLKNGQRELNQKLKKLKSINLMKTRQTLLMLI